MNTKGLCERLENRW